MNNYLLLLYPGLLLAITFYGCRICKSGEYSEPFLDRDQSSLLQGVFCVGVILHHITQTITSYGEINKGPITILSSMGILFTSIFFFFSGYGLIYSVHNKPGYLNGFLRHRLPIILVPFFVSNLVYVLIRIYYVGIPTSGINLAKLLSGIRLINGNGWYIVEIFWLYLAFYFLFRFVKSKDLALFLLIAAASGIMWLGYRSGHDFTGIGDAWFKGEWWYNSTVVFIMGALFARFSSSIFAFFKKYYCFMLPATATLFFIAFYIEEIILKTHGYYRESISIDSISSQFITFIAQSIVCLIFTLLIVLISMKITIGNRLLSLLSLISTELFLIHNTFIRDIFEEVYMNDFLRYALVLICGVISAIVMHFCDVPIIKLLQNQGRKSTPSTRQDRKARVRQAWNSIKNHKNVLLSVLVIICLISILAIMIRILFISPMECRNEMNQLQTANPGVEVLFGRYDTDSLGPGNERLAWIVLKRTDSEIMLITKEGIDSSTYTSRHVDVTWNDSDLCLYLNDDMYNRMFSRYEKSCIIPNPDSGDMLSLLSVEEASNLFPNDLSREISITEVAQNNGANINTRSKVNNWDMNGYRSSWWWLRGDGPAAVTAPIVTVDGVIQENSKHVNKPNGVIRPVLWVSLQ